MREIIRALIKLLPWPWWRSFWLSILLWMVKHKVGVILVRGLEVKDQNSTAQQVSDLIGRELSTMLCKTPAQILEQLKQPYTIVAFSAKDSTLVVGFVTLWHLFEDWFELGSLVVRNQTEPSFRGRGIATELTWLLLVLNERLNIIATAKLGRAINALVHGGLVVANFATLPEQVHQATCVCTGEGEGGLVCPKANGVCRLLICKLSLKK